MTYARGVRSLALLLGLGALALSACAQGGSILEGGGGDSRAAGSAGDTGDPGLCSLHECHGDDDCAGCSDGRFTCLTEVRRCAVCSPVTGVGCPEGETCSSIGTCVGEGQTCPVDGDGLPSLPCAGNADCAACDLLHQVCDPASSRCVSCTPTDTSACASTDLCADGSCVPACPSACADDAECGDCGQPGHEAHACNAGKCAQCSPTSPCPDGMSCSALGTCKADGGSSGSGSSSSASSSSGSSGSGGLGGGDPGGAGGSDPGGAGGGDPGGTGGGGPVGSCHDLCSAGDAMDPSCDPCAATLCAADDYCCSTAWDALCVSEVDQYCNNACSGAGGGCAHDVCAQGEALDESCSECATAVCAADAYCCSTSWDIQCVGEVLLFCTDGC